MVFFKKKSINQFPINQYSNGRPRLKTNDEIIFDLYKNKVPISEIAKNQHVSESTVRRRLKKIKLKFLKGNQEDFQDVT